MEITFKVSGFAYDQEVVATPEPTATPAPTQEPAKTETTEPAVTAAPEAPAEPEKKSNTGLVVGIVIAVLAAAGIGTGVVLSKKKK